MKKKPTETTVIDIQLIASILSIISFIATLILLYNQKLLEEKKKPFFSRKQTLEFVNLNRMFVLVIVLIFLGANRLHLKIDKEKGEDLKFDYIDIFSSILTLIVALLAIYSSTEALKNNNLDIDNSIDEAL